MKKLIFILSALLCSVFICACGNNKSEEPADKKPTTETPIVDDPYAEIKTAYYNKYKDAFVSEYYTYTVDDVCIDFYGEYNGAFVMFISAPMMGYAAAITYETVDGVQFVYSDSQTFDVYCGGSFYKLSQAFDNELLTHSDLLDIRAKHSAKEPHLYEEN